MYTTNLPDVWSLALKFFRVPGSSDNNTENGYGNGPSRTDCISNLRSKTGHESWNRAAGKVYGLETMNGRAGGPTSESKENIIQTNTMGTRPNNFGKYADGSETVSWAQSEGGLESDSGLKGPCIIHKTTEVVIKEEDIGSSYLVPRKI